MSEEAIEAAVLAFLERRTSEPALTPESFADSRPEPRAALLPALHAAIGVERLLACPAPRERRVGEYRLLGELGRGGMGVVHRAERGGKRFAIKLLPLAPLMGERLMARFRREAEALARLSHPGIVRVHESGLHEDVPYLVMDLVDGQPLHRIAASLERAQAVRLVRRLAEAVQAAHAAGVLHRDLKPQNILVRPDGSPVLLDFGLSALETGASLTQTGDFLGTPRYMAPEQAEGASADARTDVHALGLVLYELITGLPAREGGSRESLFAAARSGRLALPSHHVPDLAPELEAVILRAAARNPDERYPSARELAEDLARLESGEPTTARARGNWLGRLRGWLDLPARLRQAVAALTMPSAADRERAAALVDSAVREWTDGRRGTVIEQLRTAHRLDRREPTAPVLLAHLTGGGAARGAPWTLRTLEALQALERGEHALALEELPGSEDGGPRATLHAAIAGLAAAGAREDERAFEDLTTAARLLPGSARIHRELARVAERLGRIDEAARSYDRALERQPEALDDWLALASVHAKRRALDEGFAAIERARALAPTEHVRLLRVEASLEILRARQPEAQRLLALALEHEPNDLEARYLLAYSLDSDHEMDAAALAYERVLAIDPGHVHALICLAHLYTGASRGDCRRCDEFYAAHPDHLDLARAEGYLLRALAANAGADDWAMRTARLIAERLVDRSRIVALLTRLTQDVPRSAAVLRLEDALRRLRLTER